MQARRSSRALKATVIGVSAVIVGMAFAACVEPPPKIAAIPASGLSLRVYVFGASAQDARQAFDAAKQTNKNLAIVREGGDGEVLIGLENDSPKCVPPTALCSFKVSFRIRDNQNKVVHAATTSATANAERCADLCERALNTIVVKVVEAAAASLKGGAATDSDAAAAASTTTPTDPGGEGGVAAPSDPPSDGGAVATAADAGTTKPPAKKAGGKVKPEPPPPPPPAKPEPAICAVAHGPHLPADEAEKRAAQVEALKRLSILEQDEYDCLRKGYLDRL